ncbi:PKD domain-containing protein [Candidatus Bathyarchaeota archaeon]|nr:PKD domain-containing protein [Candidatus Bathyarchaeota archaeon]
MKTLNIIYCLRVGFGILAALVATLVVDLRMGDPLINGITIGLGVYLVTYYLLKWQFMNKVEKPTKILSMGIGAYFLVFIMCWVLFVTPFLSAPSAIIDIDNREPIIGESITFDGSDSTDIDGDIIKWIWNFGDEGTSDQKITTHIYLTAKEYLITLTVVDDHGISSSNSTTIDVKASG